MNADLTADPTSATVATHDAIMTKGVNHQDHKLADDTQTSRRWVPQLMGQFWDIVAKEVNCQREVDLTQVILVRVR